MAEKNTGDELLAYCGACKMDLMAVVVAKVGPKIARVQCKTCKKERAYRPPKGLSEPAKGSAGGASRSARGAAAESRTVEEEWTKLMAGAAAARKVKYTPKAQLQLGDVIDHPTFGQGVVTKLSHPDKASVLFREDLKMLVHSR